MRICSLLPSASEIGKPVVTATRIDSSALTCLEIGCAY